MNDVYSRISRTVKPDRVSAKIDSPVDPKIRKDNLESVYGFTVKVPSRHLEPISAMSQTVLKSLLFNDLRDVTFHFT